MLYVDLLFFINDSFLCLQIKNKMYKCCAEIYQVYYTVQYMKILVTIKHYRKSRIFLCWKKTHLITQYKYVTPFKSLYYSFSSCIRMARTKMVPYACAEKVRVPELNLPGPVTRIFLSFLTYKTLCKFSVFICSGHKTQGKMVNKVKHKTEQILY